MDKAAPLVSIVIPAYNHAFYLDEAIRSVLGQDYKNIELIVLDDGSTDHSRTVLEKYTGKFHWETQTNMGQANTLNKGWQMSRGDILGYLSADDALMPQAVSKSVDYLEQYHDAVLTYCDFNLVDPNSAVIRRVNAPEVSYADMVVRVVCPPGPGAFFRRSAFDAVGPWDASLGQMPDYDYWLRVGLQGRFIRIPEVLAAFRVHDASQTFSPASEKRAEEPVLIISRLFESGQLPSDVAQLKDTALANAGLVSAQLHFRAGRYGAGLACLRRSFSLAPNNLLSPRTLRVLANALFNRIGHKFLWTIRAIVNRRTPHFL